MTQDGGKQLQEMDQKHFLTSDSSFRRKKIEKMKHEYRVSACPMSMLHTCQF